MTFHHKGTNQAGRVAYEISWWQVAMLIVSFHLSVLASYSPMTAGSLPPVRDTWLAALIAPIPGFGFAFVVWWLAKRFEGENVFQFTRSIFGRFFGTLINVGLTVYFVHWAALLAREFAVFMASVVFLRTPETVFVIVFLILAIVGASQQIEFVGRTAELSGPLVMGGFLFLIVANIPNIDLAMLRPVLGEGWGRVVDQAMSPIGVYGEAALVSLIAMPYLNKMSDGPKAITVGLGINVVFAAMASVVLVCIFGPELLSVLAFPPLTAARLIKIGNILERLEWIMILLWFGSMGVKISLVLLGARLGLSSLLPGQRHGVALFAVASVVFVWSFFLLPTLTDVLTFFQPETYLRNTLPVQAAPIVFAAVALLRGVRKGHR